MVAVRKYTAAEVRCLVEAVQSDEVSTQLSAGFERNVVHKAVLGYYEHGRISDRHLALLAQLIGRIRERARLCQP